MIPTFPAFRRLELHDQREIEDYVRHFAPYSDFNFVSLASYDISGSFELSYLNGNLVVRMRYYITQEPFFTFIGSHRASETASALLDCARAAGDRPILRLVPEETITAMNGTAIDALYSAPDPASFDYIYAVSDLTDLSNSQLSTKRRTIRTFRANHPEHTFTALDLTDRQIANRIRGVFHAWRAEKQRSEGEVAVEYSATDRCLMLAQSIELEAHGVFLGGDLVAFTINEVVHGGFYMAHFGKALPRYRGLSELLEYETARAMQQLGCDRMNFQQDLGLPGLRAAKRGWRPAGYLKKFTLEPHP